MTSRTFPRRHAAAAAAVATILLAACAAPRPAQMERPPGLHALAEERLEGAGAGRSGRFVLAGLEGRFERSADRLGFFDDAVARDRATVRMTWRGVDGQPAELSCKAAQTTATAGIVSGAVRPLAVECTMRAGEPGRAERGGLLRLDSRAAAAGTRQERQGRWTSGDLALDIRSVHRFEGSPLPQPAPVGYVISRNGAPVGAVELNGLRPRLWRPAEGAAAREDVTIALVALALLWDPER